MFHKQKRLNTTCFHNKYAVGRGLWAVGLGPWAVSRGPWAVGCGLWAVGCGPWAVGRGLWAVGCALWAVGRVGQIPRIAEITWPRPWPWAVGRGLWAVGWIHYIYIYIYGGVPFLEWCDFSTQNAVILSVTFWIA